MVNRWTRNYRRYGEAAFTGNSSKTSKGSQGINSHLKELKETITENEKLKKLLGEKELEIEILKDLLKKQPTLTDKVEIASKWINRGYRVSLVLRIIGLSRSTYYYSLKSQGKRRYGGGRPIKGYSYNRQQEPVSDEQIKAWLKELIEGEGFAYGYVKMTIILKHKYGLIINKKKVYRLCKEMGILKPQRQIKVKHPRRLARNRIVTGPNQLWEIDIKYGYIAGEGRFFYVLSIIDVFDRSIIDYHAGLTCEARHAVYTLKSALWKRRLDKNATKPVIRTDNGSQFTSNLFAQTCKDLGVEHELIPYKTSNKNAHIESFPSILEEECLARYKFNSFREAYEVIHKFMDYYNNVRIPSKIGYLTPSGYYDAFQRNFVKALPICA
jgi:putative transposase